jgi:hypothetical protein
MIRGAILIPLVSYTAGSSVKVSPTIPWAGAECDSLIPLSAQDYVGSDHGFVFAPQQETILSLDVSGLVELYYSRSNQRRTYNLSSSGDWTVELCSSCQFGTLGECVEAPGWKFDRGKSEVWLRVFDVDLDSSEFLTFELKEQP